MERKVKERWNEGIVKIAKNLIKLGKLSNEDIAKNIGLPLSTVEEIAASMQKKKKNRA